MKKTHFPARFTPLLRSARLWHALLLSVSTALLPLAAAPGHAQPLPQGCASSGTILICTKDQSGGIDTKNPITELIVKDLNQDIAPVMGTAGISFESSLAAGITINSDTGIHKIKTTGDNAPGIMAKATDATAPILITHKGDITTNGSGSHGIDARSDGIISITHTGGAVKIGASSSRANGSKSYSFNLDN